MDQEMKQMKQMMLGAVAEETPHLLPKIKEETENLTKYFKDYVEKAKSIGEEEGMIAVAAVAFTVAEIENILA
jgi:hypothetical protein